MGNNISTTRRVTAGCAAVLVGAALFGAASPAQATTDAVPSGVVGGWSEADGIVETSAVGVHAVSHRGKSETKDIGGTTNKRAHGWTTWAGVRHYTTAQLEHYWPASGVIASSGRRWGTSGTEAVSPWRAFNPNATSNGFGAAKTYYGR